MPNKLKVEDYDSRMTISVEFSPTNETILILGAGFSKAISKLMPLTYELGKDVIESLPIDMPETLNAPNFRADGISFEVYFSGVAPRQRSANFVYCCKALV